MPTLRPLRSLALAAVSLACAQAAWAQPVTCHLSYAGHTRAFTVRPAVCPQDMAPLVEGASFALKVINRALPAEQAGVTIETYTDVAGQLQLTHRVHYEAWEAGTTHPGTAHGFTGRQTVQGAGYSQGLSYWCERLVAPPVEPRDCEAGPGFAAAR
jgi:hypothetical protein